ncbi:MAG: hypothetical protein GY885_06730, partial [Phycisphaeraceae bacterium]|nr:hypothetical protein [Phycisphaeraceae bacterium]
SLTELDALPLRERIACPSAEAPDERRRRLLRNIAVAASRAVIEQATRPPIPPDRPSRDDTGKTRPGRGGGRRRGDSTAADSIDARR